MCLCFPVFLVILFDTGILYQVAVFLYGCTNGLFVQKLGQVVSWSDLIVQFEKGVSGFRSRMLSNGAEHRWRTDDKVVQRYFERDKHNVVGESAPPGNGARYNGNGVVPPHAEAAAGYAEESSALATAGTWNSPEYVKWGPFSHAWDVRSLHLKLFDGLHVAVLHTGI